MNKKISYKDISDRIYNDQETITASLGDVDIEVKRCLSLQEFFSVVNNVVDSCFKTDSGEYCPEARDFALRANLIDAYTNIELPEGAEEQFKFVSSDTVITFIEANINTTQRHSIASAIDNKIAHILQANVERFNTQVEELYDTLSELDKSIRDIAGDISSDEMRNALKAINENGIDEEKIVKAYLNNK